MKISINNSLNSLSAETQASDNKKTNYSLMKKRIKIIGTVVLLSLGLNKSTIAQVGKPFIHDPSTITECDGKYYTFGTGAGGLISEDGWRWNEIGRAHV